jgi:CubicO group peptidase (beta-lactamase class C family)
MNYGRILLKKLSDLAVSVEDNFSPAEKVVTNALIIPKEYFLSASKSFETCHLSENYSNFHRIIIQKMTLRNKIVLLSVLFLAAAVLLPCKAQEKQYVLIRGKRVSELLKSGETHRYSINLQKNKFAFFRLIQEGVDAMITTYDPEGNRIQSFDSPNGRHGPELVTLFSDKKGNYIFEVKALEPPGWQGYYDLTWEKLEPKGSSPAKQIDQLLTPWNDQEIPGAAIAVEKDGKIIFEKGYGSADLEYNIPITPSTVFHIASLSKQFTAFSILLLEKEGKLSINDDVRKYIPEVPDFGKVITLNHLLHHTSGLRDQWNLLALAGWRLDDIITTDQILRLVSTQKSLNFNPGDEFVYCNTGFTLLAEVVARVSGKSFPEFTRTNIFEPLKMTNTLFYDDCEKIVKNRAYSYHTDSTGLKKSILSYSTVGATSLFTTVDDLSRWAANFENPVVGKDVVKRMEMRGTLNNGDTISYAMGQVIDKFKGLKLIAHSGADAGYRTALMRFPDEKFSVNILSNLASFNPSGMAAAIADIYLKDKELVESPEKEAEVKLEHANINENAIVEVNPDSLKAYCGVYELVPGNVVTFTSEDNKIFIEAPELPKTAMVPVSTKTFSISVAQAVVTFVRDMSGKIDHIKVEINGQEHLAKRLADFDPAKIDLTQYTGEYYSPELCTAYSVVAESGKLIARHFRTGDVHLSPVKTDFFSGDQWYFGSVEFVKDKGNIVTGCKVSAGRIRNIMFVKEIK